MVKKKRNIQEKKVPIRISLEEYQRAIKKAGDSDVIQDIQKIYTKSETQLQREKAERLAKQSSKGYIGYGLSSSKISPSEKKFTSAARKLINVFSPQGSMVKSLTHSGQESQGRGRPKGTYKPRYVPGMGFVNVPTSTYNKLMSEYKTKQRLALAQAQIQQQAIADQQAMQTDGRFQPDYSDEQFLEGEDYSQGYYPPSSYPQSSQYTSPEALQSQIPQKQGVISRVVQGMSNLGRVQPIQQRNPFFNPPQQRLYGSSGYPQQIPPQMMGSAIREPKVTIISDKANLLKVPNQFDRPENAQILFKGRPNF
jgi:hypothetical protein